ncbi:Proteasome subunit beta type-4, partial [Coemansia sp. RSA 1836]
VPFAAHGYCGYFLYAVMDREYTPHITLDGAKALIKKCFEVLKTRFIVDYADYTIKVVDKSGTRVLNQDEL